MCVLSFFYLNSLVFSAVCLFFSLLDVCLSSLPHGVACSLL